MQLPWYLSSHSTYIAPSRCTFRALLFPRLDQRKEITLLYEELEQWWSLATFRVRGTRMEPWVSARNKPVSNHIHFSHTGFRVNGKKKASASKSSVSVFKLNLWPRHFSRFREILSLESGETPPLSSGNNEGHLDTFSTLYVTIALGRPILLRDSPALSVEMFLSVNSRNLYYKTRQWAPWENIPAYIYQCSLEMENKFVGCES